MNSADAMAMLRDALADLLDTALAVDDVEWSRAVVRTHATLRGTGPCDRAAQALDMTGGWYRPTRGAA